MLTNLFNPAKSSYLIMGLIARSATKCKPHAAKLIPNNNSFQVQVRYLLGIVGVLYDSRLT